MLWRAHWIGILWLRLGRDTYVPLADVRKMDFKAVNNLFRAMIYNPSSEWEPLAALRVRGPEYKRDDEAHACEYKGLLLLPLAPACFIPRCALRTI